MAAMTSATASWPWPPPQCRGCVLACLLALLLPASAAVAAEATAESDRAFVERAVDEAVARYDLPGIAVGVITPAGENIRVVRGELLAGSGQKIDAATLFKFASNTKAMTAAVLARLVEDGKLRWDDPVVKHLPDFRMFDPWVTREMQVRDLLIHNSGLGAGAGDLMLWPDPNLFTRADVIHGLRYLKPATSFRSRYAYDNSLYIVAGEVAAAAGGAPFDVLVKREVFAPLGMARCQAGIWSRDGVGNVAQPHARRDGRNVPTRVDADTIPDVPMLAAGGIRCGLDDMLRWLHAWLPPPDAGAATDRSAAAVGRGGAAWLGAAQRAEVWKPHTLMPLSERMRAWDRSHYSAYGYGWRLTDVDGTAKVSHTGTLGGMYSATVLLPEKRAALVLLINGDADEARTVLTQVLVKRFTAPASRPTVAGYAARLAAEQETADAESGSRIADTRDRVEATAVQLRSVAGVYRDPWFGEVAVCMQASRAMWSAARSPKMVGNVMRSRGRWLVQWRNPDVDEEPWLRFVSASSSGPARMTMARIDPDGDFSSDYQDLAFERVADCAAG